MRGPAGWAACLGGLPAMAEAVGRRRAGQDAACRATQPPSAPHPQQPPPKDSSLSWQEAKGGLQSRGQEGWDLGDTHGIAREASPRLHLCPLPWTHCSLHQWVPPLCWLPTPWCGGEPAAHQQQHWWREENRLGCVGRTFFFSVSAPSFQAASIRAQLLCLWAALQADGGSDCWVHLGHWPLASSPWGRGPGGCKSESL